MQIEYAEKKTLKVFRILHTWQKQAKTRTAISNYACTNMHPMHTTTLIHLIAFDVRFHQRQVCFVADILHFALARKTKYIKTCSA